MLALLAGQALAADDLPPAAAERIARVERGLLPAERIAGANAAPWTLAARMAAYRVPGVSIAVIHDGAVEWARSYGVLAAGSPAAATADTLFQAASISKPVAALAALRLVAAGELPLDEDVNAKLKSWRLPLPPVAGGETVTLRRLLSHTAGLAVHGFPGYAADAPRPTLVQVLDGVRPANTGSVRIEVKPGTQWRYSGGGYCVLQQLLTDRTGEDFTTLMRDRVLRPAGMNDSTFEQPLPAAWAGRAATGHHVDGQPVAGGAHVYPEQAAAGLWTTATDLARFALGLQQSLVNPGGLLPKALAESMATPILPDSEYGLGIGTKGSGERLLLSHGGANEGFQSMLVLYPHLGRGAVVLTNSDNGSRLISEILRGLAREYGWPDYQVVERAAHALPAGTFGAYVGRYEREDTVLTFTERDGRYFVQSSAGTRREIFAQSKSEFFTLTSPDVFVFERNASGAVTHLVLRTSPPQIFQRTSR